MLDVEYWLFYPMENKCWDVSLQLISQYQMKKLLSLTGFDRCLWDLWKIIADMKNNNKYRF